MNTNLKISLLVLPILLGACATVPNGPTVQVMPGSTKNFDQFRADDASCRDFAQFQIGGASAQQAANNSMVNSAAAGTAIGAVVGAAVGGHQGAGVGAATGLLFGTEAGVGASHRSAYSTQQQYNNAYIQCMYAKGNRVPVSGRFVTQPSYTPQPSMIPPPPPGYAPPPPPPPGNPPPPPPPSSGGVLPVPPDAR
jgi:hypothetical protein